MSCAIFQSFEHLVEECPILPAAREMFGMPCGICQSFEHLVECPIIPVAREIFGDYNTYNSNCRNHPNFFWEPQPRQYMQPAQAPHQALKLEQAIVNLTKVVEDFVAHQKSIIDQFRQKNAQVRQEINSQDRKMDERLNDLSQKTDNLEYSRSRLINLNTEREKENFPSQPYQHLKGIHKGEAQKKENSMVRKVKVVMVDQPTFKPKHDEGFQLGVFLQRRPRLQSQESPPEHLEIHSLSLLPPGVLSSPARPLRATPIADREHSMSRHILITLFCDSNLSWGIHTAYLRALDFYQSMTTRGVPVPTSILFTIDGRQGILGARQIAEAFLIPYAPADPVAFRRWVPLSEWDMVRILSQGTSSYRIIMRKEPPPGMLLVDVTLILRPAAIVERASLLTNGIQVFLHQHSPELPEPREVPPQPLSSISAPSTSPPSEPVSEAASSDAPPAVPPTSEPPITIPGAEYHDLLASFQTLTTTQTIIMERMDHFQLRQDQQTLILREIQQHLDLLPPAPPVAPVPSEPSAPADDATPVVVPSTVAAEDPSYPPEEPTT
uniref:Uncharacterized protein n=1 Tax=Vitis vinifera TaxID=29760 RepID=A5C8B6_VITVI|nr:hypothetical protein VITISV_016874 [Vitis vinifera]